jgi:hypothetical protein
MGLENIQGDISTEWSLFSLPVDFAALVSIWWGMAVQAAKEGIARGMTNCSILWIRAVGWPGNGIQNYPCFFLGTAWAGTWR